MELLSVTELAGCATAHLDEILWDEPLGESNDDGYIVASSEMLQITRRAWEE